MKIEFSKVPHGEKEFELKLDSVSFSGTFSRISSRLAKMNAQINGNLSVYCSKCGNTFSINIDENQLYILSDGPFASQDERDDELVIEIEDHMIDFDEILRSEVASIDSDIHICNNCIKNDTFVDIEI